MTHGAGEIHDALLDEAIAAGEPRALVWEPQAPLVVLGRSNEAARECDLEACRELAVPVVQRRGGGGTVVLLSGMVVITLAGPSGPRLDARALFGRVNQHIASILAPLGVQGLRPQGLSDLCLADRKVLGCSLAFRRGFALYQGSLLVDCDLGLVARCLRHPSREPAYRAGRPHRAFLTTLAEAGCDLSPSAVRRALERGLDPQTLATLMGNRASEARCA